ncbi:MAG TPA: acyltransferase family protein, partial [Candidatus Dormibacteraeota bacterium]|nr:acyltransferase family protein [Candidatus Dormibacteraeota bacterium]
YVLSGFLITGLLLRERDGSGRIDLGAFYARRARRILPAAVVVLLGTVAVASVVLGPLDMERIAGDAVASALFVGNLRFAATTADYFSASQTPSPLLHYWSLGVEEQWYLLFPALLIVATRGRRPRLGAGLALAVVTLASLVGALVLTQAAATWAFYSLPTRAWQLSIGGLLAVTAAWHGRIPDRLAAIAGWAGLGAILLGLVVFDAGTPYPGTAALLPTLGAAALILAGTRPRAPAALLVVRPLRWLGRISYSLYLVHWPLLVLPAAGLAIGETLPLDERVALAAASIGLAALSYRFVEAPIRERRRLGLPERPTLALAGAAIAVVVAVALSAGAVATETLAAYAGSSVRAASAGAVSGADDAALVPGSAGGGGSTGGGAVVLGAGSGTGAATPDESMGVDGSAPRRGAGQGGAGPSGSPPVASASGPGSGSASPALAGLTPTPVPQPMADGAQPLPRSIRPPLGAASTDWEALVTDGCTLADAGTVAHECVFGDTGSPTTVALVGDSHAAQWFPALERVAAARGWRLVTFTKISCRFFDLPIYSRVEKREYTECEAWRPNVVAALERLRPDLTIVSVAEGMQPMVPADDDPTRQGLAVARLLAPVPGAKAVIVDTPASVYDVPTCLADHLGDTRACRTSRSLALSWRHLKLERAAVGAMPGSTLVDLTNAVCPGDPCPVVLDGTIVYRDSFHMTATFAATLAPALAAALPTLGVA